MVCATSAERIEELKPYDLPGVVETLRRGLEKEIDFRNEARSLAFFALQNPYPESVHAPKIYEELCSKRVLVMERIDGKRLSELEADTPESKQIADNGSRSLFHQILITGFFHADPHEGNLRLMPDGRLCLLDWGLGRSTDPSNALWVGRFVFSIYPRKCGKGGMRPRSI